MKRLLGMVLLLAQPVVAADLPVSAKEARDLVYPANKAEVVLLAHPSLSAQDRAIIQQVAVQQAYYAAMAMSPDEGLASNATVAATHYHDVEHAKTAALAACNERRKPGTADCALVAIIQPKDWQQRPLQLGADATTALRKDYRKGRGPKAFAISPSTGKWAISKGDTARDTALKDCAIAAQSDDCVVVIAD